MLKPIKSEQLYGAAPERVYMLMQKNIRPDSKESDELEVLSILIKEYENDHYPVQLPNPIEASKFRLEQLNISRKRAFGGTGLQSQKI